MSQPNVDGTVRPFEYYDGKQVPMTGFTAGVDDVEGFILVSGAPSPTWASNCTIASSGSGLCRAQTLFLGFRVPIATIMSGHLDIFVDGRRDDTFLPQNDVPKSDDRRILINYENASPTSSALGSVTVRQFRGALNTWQDVTGTSGSVDMLVAVTNQGDGTLHFELRLALTGEMVVINEKLGLGVSHRTVGGGPIHSIPNQSSPVISFIRPSTWQTVELRDYDPIPVEVVTYNIGQMPTIIGCQLLPGSGCIIIPLSDGGEGYPTDFADEVFDKEIVCLQESWSRANREELLDEIDERRSQANLTPMHVVGAPPSDNPDGDGAGLIWANNNALVLCLWVPWGPIWLCENQHVDQYTGLLLMSEREHLTSQLFEFGEQESGQCYGAFEPFFSGDWGDDFDCGQDKGMAWARILTEASEITTTSAASGVPVPVEGHDASQFIDVFCTHADSGSGAENHAAADADYTQLKLWIDSVRAPDRPAVLAGDMNADWHLTDTPNPATDAGSVRHDSLMSRLGIATLTTFDQINTTFSDVYDIAVVDGMGRRVGTYPHSGNVTSGGGCNAVTNVNMVHAPVYDYVLLLPPPNDPTTFPNFAVQKDPTASVNEQFRVNADPVPSECLSDHAMVTARFSLAQTYEPGKWNPSRTHTVRHRVSSVLDFEEGAESDSLWEASTHRAAVGTTPGNWSTDCNTVHPPDDARVGQCTLDWHSCDVTVNGTEFAGAFLDLDDEEGVGVFNFDTSSVGSSGTHQRSPHFVFDHFLGSWTKATDGWSAIGQATRLDDLNVPPNDKKWPVTYELEGDGFFGNEETDYRARLTHILEVEE